MKALPIWSYWEGEAPPYVELCLEILRAHHPDAGVLDLAEFQRLRRHDRDIAVEALSPGHQSDFARAYLLAHYGGLFLDADCILLRSLAPLLALARRHRFVGYRQPFGFMAGNLMAAAKVSAVARVHYQRVVDRVRKPDPLRWLDLSSVQLEVAMATVGATAHIVPTEEIVPLPASAFAELVARGTDAEHRARFDADARCYMLSNRTLALFPETRALLEMSRAELLADDSFFGFLFRAALNAAPRSDPLIGGVIMAKPPPLRIAISRC